jgi:type II secretory pathway component PulF
MSLQKKRQENAHKTIIIVHQITDVCKKISWMSWIYISNILVSMLSTNMNVFNRSHERYFKIKKMGNNMQQWKNIDFFSTLSTLHCVQKS